MAVCAAQPEAGMHRLQGSDAIGFRHHAAGADLTGGDQFDFQEAFASLPSCDEIDWLRQALRLRRALQRPSSYYRPNGQSPARPSKRAVSRSSTRERRPDPEALWRENSATPYAEKCAETKGDCGDRTG